MVVQNHHITDTYCFTGGGRLDNSTRREGGLSPDNLVSSSKWGAPCALTKARATADWVGHACSAVQKGVDDKLAPDLRRLRLLRRRSINTTCREEQGQ